MIHNRLKFTSLMLVSSWLRGRVLDWRLTQPGFDPSYGNLVCLATLMSSDRTKQICLWMTIYIYIYIIYKIRQAPTCGIRTQWIRVRSIVVENMVCTADVDPIGSKQLFSLPYVTCRCLPNFLVMVIQLIQHLFKC